tara:strand:+ start:2556 stop:3161 length:606 start_codon:yes stop_codon:yes gene_type:complete
MNVENIKKEFKKKPKFVRQQSVKNKLKSTWRKPKGLHSKLRLRKGGKGKVPRVGYGSPKLSKNLISGFKIAIIHNFKDLGNIDPKSENVLISKSVGKKKKVELLKKIKDLGIKVLNIKNIDAFIKKVEEDLLKRKETKKKTEEKKKKAKKEAEEKAEAKKKEEEKSKEEKTEEEVKEEKKEKDKEQKKILEKKTAREDIER